MHPNFRKMAQEKLRQKIEERAARPNVFGAFGDLISSIGYSIKERFDKEGMGSVEDFDLPMDAMPPFGPYGGGGPSDFDGGATIVSSAGPTKARYIIMPLGLKIDGAYWPPGNVEMPTDITMEEGCAPPGVIVALTGRPQVIFRPEQLFLDAEEATHFEIYDIRVGKNSQFAASGAVAAKFFSEDNSIRLKLDTVQVSMDVSVLLRNTSDKPQKIHGMLLGPMVE